MTTIYKLALALMLVACGNAIAQTSLWTNSPVPGTKAVPDDSNSVTLGLKFSADVAGSVTAVRFYKGTANTGTHIGSLWSASGTKLAQVQFSGETASGWQQANFSSPVAIAANTTYVVSYLAPVGSYSEDDRYAWSGISAAPLHVVGSAPGVYGYGSSPVFPTGTWNAANYWVDLVFAPSSSSSLTYSISGHVTGAAASLSLSGAASASTATDSSGNFTFSGLKNGSYVIAPSQSGYAFSPSTASATVNSSNVSAMNFTATASAHSVMLSWSASNSANVNGYNVYRATSSGGPYAKLNTSLVGGTGYVSSNVASGQTYYYVATAVNSSNSESGYSPEAAVKIPTP